MKSPKYLPPSKRSLMFLGTVPECDTPDGIWRAWRALPSPPPLPTERRQRTIAEGLAAAEITEHPRRWLADHRRASCVRLAVQQVVLGWRFELEQPGSTEEHHRLVDHFDVDDDSLASQFSRILTEAPQRPEYSTGRHPLVGLVGEYATPGADLFAWIEANAPCTAVDIAFEDTMTACAAAAARVAADAVGETVIQVSAPPLQAPYDRIRLTRIAVSRKDIRVISTASTAVWSGFTTVTDDHRNEYLQIGLHRDERPSSRAKIMTVEQRFYPAPPPNAQKLHLVINAIDRAASTIEVDLPER